MADDTKHDFLTRKFDCPQDLFGEGKFIIRKRRIKTKVVRQMEAAVKTRMDFGELYELMARYTIEWNLDDIDSGEPLPQPYENSAVFDELDSGEQLPWVVNIVFLNPPNFPRGR